MHISGERLVPAPRERVWRSLTDAALLQECVPGGRIEPDGDGGLLLYGPGHGDLAPLRAQPSIREPFSTLGWRIDPSGPGNQMVLVRLVEQGVFTRLQYEVSIADPDDAASGPEDERVRARIEAGLERFVHAIAGPGEIGAGGIAGAVQAATEPSAQPTASMRAEPASGPDGIGGQPSALLGLLNPSVIGGMLFLIVVLFMVGLF